MMSRWGWVLRAFGRKLWLRVSAMALVGVVTAAAGVLFAPWVPDAWVIAIGAPAIDGILHVLASSMLAVAVFSLSTMVNAYGAATSNVSPRATRLLIEDNTSQNVLGTFIGSFLFSLVGIIALSTGLYDQRGRAILLIATIGLIVLIAVTILRWIDYLTRFGRLGETIQRVEDATWDAMETRLAHPHLGARPMEGEAPPGAWPVFAPSVGYVQHVDVAALQRCAAAAGAVVYVTASPGAFADPARPVALVFGADDPALGPQVAQAFTVGVERTFDQDPRFGLCVLAEIASRALSAAVNDPGTAIDVIGRAVRLLTLWARHEPAEADAEAACTHVRAPALRAGDLFDDVFAPIARDGAGQLEVQLRLQKAFVALAAADPAAFGAAARRHAATALERSDRALDLQTEKQAVRAMAALVGRDATWGAAPALTPPQPQP